MFSPTFAWSILFHAFSCFVSQRRDEKFARLMTPQNQNWGAFDLPKSESGFEIMILIHRFIERIGNRISNRVDHTQFMIVRVHHNTKWVGNGLKLNWGKFLECW